MVGWSNRFDLRLRDVLKRFPELVIGNYLVNTSFDSGFLMLSDAKREAGWRMAGNLGHSPRISGIDQVPHDQYDEWLVFDRPVEVKEFETMVNYADFSPIDFDWAEKQDRFWAQILTLNPLHVLGENEGVYLVSRDWKLMQRIQTMVY